MCLWQIVRKIVIIFLTISLNICFGCSKDMFYKDIRKMILSFTLLYGVLTPG